MHRPMVTVNGVPLPEPAWNGYRSTVSTFVDAARNLEGVMIGDVLRADVAKVECSWLFLTAEQWASILSLFAGKPRFSASVTFFLQDTNSWVTKHMYVSDRTATAYMRNEETGAVRGYRDCRIALIQV